MLSSCLSWLVLRATEAKLLLLLLNMRFNQPLLQTKTFVLTRLNCKFLFSIIQGQIKIQNITLTNYFTNDLIIWLNFSFFFLLVVDVIAVSSAHWDLNPRSLYAQLSLNLRKRSSIRSETKQSKSYRSVLSSFWEGHELSVFRFKGW